MDVRLAVAVPKVFLIRSSLAHAYDETLAIPMLELRN